VTAVLQAGHSWVAVLLRNARHLLVQITKTACSSDDKLITHTESQHDVETVQ
jgi:hypothetical protein